MVFKNHNENLEEVLKRLKNLQVTIRNLQRCKGTMITELGRVDEKLCNEIVDYELLTEQLKLDFVAILVDDSRQLAAATKKNPLLAKKNDRALSVISQVFDELLRNEDLDIKKSKELQRHIKDAQGELERLTKDMDTAAEESAGKKRDFWKSWQKDRKFK